MNKFTDEEAMAAVEAGEVAVSVGTLHSLDGKDSKIALRFMAEGRQHVGVLSSESAIMIAHELISRAMGTGMKDYTPTLCLEHREAQDSLLAHISIHADALMTAGERLTNNLNTAQFRTYGILYAKQHAALLSFMNQLIGLWIVCPEMLDTVEAAHGEATQEEVAEAEATEGAETEDAVHV